MKEKVTIPLDICIPEHCYECPFWAGEDTSSVVGDSMTFLPVSSDTRMGTYILRGISARG